MNYLGHGGSRDFVNARAGFETVLHDPSRPRPFQSTGSIYVG